MLSKCGILQEGTRKNIVERTNKIEIVLYFNELLNFHSSA